jgi:eukaryotic-like serine/threonine-protein kinase
MQSPVHMHVGEVVAGRFRLEEELGRGGMGVVFAATQLDLGRRVAVKVLHDGARPTALARFRREARVLARLDHPHAVHIHELVETDGLALLSMELVHGETLDARLARLGPPAMDEVLLLLTQVAEVLDRAHRFGVVHRDLKPANLMVELREGRPFVRVVDFGIAQLHDDSVGLTRVTKTGVVTGTPAYMAPEQCRGFAIDGRADLYALACVGFELVTGRTPFLAESAADLVAAHLYLAPPAVSGLAPSRQLPPTFDRVLAQGLAKRPEDRPSTTLAFVEALRVALASPSGRSPHVNRALAGASDEWIIASVDDAAVGVWAPLRHVAERDMLLNALAMHGLRAVPLTEDVAPREGPALGAVVVLCDDPTEGLEACRRFVGRLPVLWSVGDDVSVMTKAISAGVYDAMSWPVDPADAARRVLRAVRHGKERR